MPALTSLSMAKVRRAELDPSSTATEFRLQWHNPKEVMGVLLIIGGDLIQKALAQLSGGLIVPVSFSFGWISYSFSTIVAMAGEGRLMPQPDYLCKVVNTKNGYIRENQSWVLGRLLRDAEPPIDQESLLIEVFVARKYRSGRLRPGECKRGWSFWLGIVTIVVQLGVAAIPFAVYGDWGVFMITVAGTILALITGSLHQWKAEKFTCRENTTKTIALTRGNGSRYVMVIIGCRRGLDLEDMASGEGPRAKKVWEKSGIFKKKYSASPLQGVDEPAKLAKRNNTNREQDQNDSDLSEPDLTPEQTQPKDEVTVYTWRGLPMDLWLTRTICLGLIVAWTAILIAASALDENAWFLFAVGTIGMAQNAVVASVHREPEERGIHLKKIYTEGREGKKVMHVLMDIESVYPDKKIGRSLVKEFFPGELRPAEKDWWAGKKDAYDTERFGDEKKVDIEEQAGKTMTAGERTGL